MKTSLKWVLAFMAMALLAGTCSAQHVLDNTGKVVQKPKTTATTVTTIKAADPIYATVDGIVYYKGAKGGIYSWKISKKTGQKYKSYLRKQK